MLIKLCYLLVPCYPKEGIQLRSERESGNAHVRWNCVYFRKFENCSYTITCLIFDCQGMIINQNKTSSKLSQPIINHAGHVCIQPMNTSESCVSMSSFLEISKITITYFLIEYIKSSVYSMQYECTAEIYIYLYWYVPSYSRIRTCAAIQSLLSILVLVFHPWLWPSMSWQRVCLEFNGPYHGTTSYSKYPKGRDISFTTHKIGVFCRSRLSIMVFQSTLGQIFQSIMESSM